MDLKPITREGVPAALQKAERYRLLNDSSAAESICLDVLEIDPDNQEATVSLLLAITDQFGEEMGDGVRRAREVLPRITDEYERTYYAGIICARSCTAAALAQPRSRRRASARPWAGMRKPSRCARRETTRRFCAGTRALACSVDMSGFTCPENTSRRSTTETLGDGRRSMVSVVAPGSGCEWSNLRPACSRRG